MRAYEVIKKALEQAGLHASGPERVAHLPGSAK